MSGWFGEARTYFSRTLYEHIPTYLFHKGERFLKQGGHLSNSMTTFRMNEVPVYDLVNCGPRARFLVLGSKPFLVSNCVQRGGHDFHILLVGLVHRAMAAAGVQHTGIVWDFHDQLIVQVPVDRAAEVCQIVSGCVDTLNEGLGLTVRLKGDPTVAENMAAAKMQEEWEKWAAKNRGGVS